MRRPIPRAVPCARVCNIRAPNRLYGRRNRPMTDGSREHLKMTAGLDLGDKYSHLCLLDAQSGEIVEESRLRTAPEVFGQRFDSIQKRLKIAKKAPRNGHLAYARSLAVCYKKRAGPRQ